MSYADLAEYCPSPFQFQVILSCSAGFRTNWEIRGQRVINSCICCSVETPLGDLVQVAFHSSFHTGLFFRSVRRKREGAMSFGALPCNHRECHNFVVLPSPMVTVVETWKNSSSALSSGSSIFNQGLVGSVHAF